MKFFALFEFPWYANTIIIPSFKEDVWYVWQRRNVTHNWRWAHLISSKYGGYDSKVKKERWESIWEQRKERYVVRGYMSLNNIGINIVFHPDLVHREVLGKSPSDPDQLRQLVVLALLCRGLVLLVIHQKAHLGHSLTFERYLFTFTSLYTFLSQNFWKRRRKGRTAS